MVEREDLEKIVGQLQMQNQQLQTILMQKQTMMVQSREVEKALDALEKCSDEVYKSVGPILVKTTKDDMKKELTESKEDIDLKMASLDKQEKRIKEHIKEAQDKFKDMVPERHVGQGG
jgi:prefoldin beta subunit